MSKKRSVITAAFFVAFLFLAAGLYTFLSPGRTADKKFETYTDSLFCREVCANTISLHYTLKDPAAYGIKNPPVTLGYCSTDSASMCAYAENALALLRSHDRKKLCEENQLTYDVLESYLSSSLRQSKYALYDEPLAPLTGTQAQLPVLLSEYQFYGKSDIDTYLDLLAQVPEYFKSILAFESEKSRQGLFMSESRADAIIRECEAFINMGKNNYLHSSFAERVNQLGLPEEDTNSYIQKNTDYIEQYLYPAYEEMKTVLHELRATGKNSGGLCNLPDGDSYYELVVANETGSDRSIPELQKLTKKQMTEDLAAMQKILSSISTDPSSPSSDQFKSQGAILSDSNPSSILASLQEKLDGSFPEPPKVNTQIKFVQKSMEEYLSPAFYMIPAIDNAKENVIYLNPGHMPDDLSLFTTLAHEGYPGHLYQTVYFNATQPNPIRSLLNFGGYTEGWATYSEMLSYYFAPIEKEQAALMQHNNSVLLGLYALADMGIHYDGWTLLDTVTFFRSYGISDTDAIEEIYDLILSDPANYLKYYIGYVEFLELKKEAIEKWGKDFSQERFHQAVLDVGPAPFKLIREYIF